MKLAKRKARRRRLTALLGLAAIVLVSSTACIFDKGDYQGGGRVDKGATANTADSTAAPPPTDAASPPATDGTQPEPLDAGTNG